MDNHNLASHMSNDSHKAAMIDPLASPDPTLREEQENDQAQPKKRTPAVALDAKLLLSENGLPRLRRQGKIMKFYGKGREDEDLKRLMEFYQMWAHSLYPRLNLRDFSKRVVKVCGQRQCKETLNVWREELVQHKSIDNMQGELSGITIEDNEESDGEAGSDDIWGRPAEPFAPTHISPEPDSARQSGNNDEHQAGSLTEEQKRRIEENRLKALAKRRVQTTDQQNQEGMLWDPLEDLQEQQEQQDEEYVDPAEEYI